MKLRHVLPLLAATPLFLVSCDGQDGPLEEAGETADEAADEAADTVEDAVDEVEDAVDDAH